MATSACDSASKRRCTTPLRRDLDLEIWMGKSFRGMDLYVHIVCNCVQCTYIYIYILEFHFMYVYIYIHIYAHINGNCPLSCLFGGFSFSHVTCGQNVHLRFRDVSLKSRCSFLRLEESSSTGYPLVIQHSYGKSPFRVDVSIEHSVFPVRYVSHYQRLTLPFFHSLDPHLDPTGHPWAIRQALLHPESLLGVAVRRHPPVRSDLR